MSAIDDSTRGHLPMVVIVPIDPNIPTIGPCYLSDGQSMDRIASLCEELGLAEGTYTIRELVPGEELLANIDRWNAIRDGLE